MRLRHLKGEKALISSDLTAQSERFGQLTFRLVQAGHADPFAEKKVPMVIVSHFLEVDPP